MGTRVLGMGGGASPTLTNGAAHVNMVASGPFSATHNRFLDAADIAYAANTNSATWTAGENVTQVTITPSLAAATAGGLGAEYVLVCFDAPDAATAGVWLADLTPDPANDVEYFKVPVGQSRTFRFGQALTRADFVSTVNNTIVMIEAS